MLIGGKLLGALANAPRPAPAQAPQPMARMPFPQQQPQPMGGAQPIGNNWQSMMGGAQGQMGQLPNYGGMPATPMPRGGMLPGAPLPQMPQFNQQYQMPAVFNPANTNPGLIRTFK